MSQLNTDSRVAELRRNVHLEIDSGRLDEAIRLCNDAVVDADRLEDDDLRDVAICIRGGLQINIGQGQSAVRELRQVLLRSRSAANSSLAAHAISQHHELLEEKERSLFYGRLALDHAKRSEQAELLVLAYNRLANLMVLDSYFEEAVDYYGEALARIPEELPRDRALVLSNKGYCQAVLGEFNKGLKSLLHSLDLIRKHCAETWERYPRLGLSYAFLELGRLEQARIHGLRALRQSEAAESPEQIKNSLYLLGETEKMAGNEAEAWEYFERLQYEFYPDNPTVIEFLMATNIRKLINLMA